MFGVAPDMITTLRGTFTLGNTPMIHNGMMAKNLEEFKPDLREQFIHYSTSPDKKKGWATIIHLSEAAEDTYLFTPKGLDRKRKYAVTFDNTGKTETIDGSVLMTKGLSIQLHAQPHSELLIFQAK